MGQAPLAGPQPCAYIAAMLKSETSEKTKGDRIAKVMARVGLCSRREAERWINDGRVKLNGQTLNTPAVTVTEADTILERYAATVDRAKQVLENSGRDPQRRPGGFKHLEISLRKQLRQLADLKDLYSFDRQEVINRAIACAKAVKQRMIASLFGSGNTVRQGGGSTGSAPAGKINDCSPCRSR